jgi:hypothetical protein
VGSGFDGVEFSGTPICRFGSRSASLEALFSIIATKISIEFVLFEECVGKYLDHLMQPFVFARDLSTLAGP